MNALILLGAFGALCAVVAIAAVVTTSLESGTAGGIGVVLVMLFASGVLIKLGYDQRSNQQELQYMNHLAQEVVEAQEAMSAKNGRGSDNILALRAISPQLEEVLDKEEYSDLEVSIDYSKESESVRVQVQSERDQEVVRFADLTQELAASSTSCEQKKLSCGIS